MIVWLHRFFYFHVNQLCQYDGTINNCNTSSLKTLLVSLFCHHVLCKIPYRVRNLKVPFPFFLCVAIKHFALSSYIQWQFNIHLGVWFCVSSYSNRGMNYFWICKILAVLQIWFSLGKGLCLLNFKFSFL